MDKVRYHRALALAVRLRDMREVASDRASRRLVRERAPDQLPHVRDSLHTLQYERDHRTRLHETGRHVEVVPPSQLGIHLPHPNADDLQAGVLEPLDQPADKSAGDSIRLEQYQRPFNCCHGLLPKSWSIGLAGYRGPRPTSVVGVVAACRRAKRLDSHLRTRFDFSRKARLSPRYPRRTARLCDGPE